jgi:hypothetical protein
VRDPRRKIGDEERGSVEMHSWDRRWALSAADAGSHPDSAGHGSPANGHRAAPRSHPASAGNNLSSTEGVVVSSEAANGELYHVI